MEDNTRQCTLCKKVLNSSSDYHMRRHQEGSDCKQPQQRGILSFFSPASAAAAPTTGAALEAPTTTTTTTSAAALEAPMDSSSAAGAHDAAAEADSVEIVTYFATTGTMARQCHGALLRVASPSSVKLSLGKYFFCQGVHSDRTCWALS